MQLGMGGRGAASHGGEGRSTSSDGFVGVGRLVGKSGYEGGGASHQVGLRVSAAGHQVGWGGGSVAGHQVGLEGGAWLVRQVGLERGHGWSIKWVGGGGEELGLRGGSSWSTCGVWGGGRN